MAEPKAISACMTCGMTRHEDGSYSEPFYQRTVFEALFDWITGCPRRCQFTPFTTKPKGATNET
ncbi:MAG TPA: hypothetical protein VEQ17_02780 [Steroidobacteraceae bacterium]|nr:hypothetical protein [Steroidobacteraceae bacterium]